MFCFLEKTFDNVGKSILGSKGHCWESLHRLGRNCNRAAD